MLCFTPSRVAFFLFGSLLAPSPFYSSLHPPLSSCSFFASPFLRHLSPPPVHLTRSAFPSPSSLPASSFPSNTNQGRTTGRLFLFLMAYLPKSITLTIQPTTWSLRENSDRRNRFGFGLSRAPVDGKICANDANGRTPAGGIERVDARRK